MRKISSLLLGKPQTLSEPPPSQEYVRVDISDIDALIAQQESLKQDIQHLKEALETIMPIRTKNEYSGLSHIIDILTQQKMPTSFIEYFQEYTQEHYTVTQLEDIDEMENILTQFIIDRITIYETPKKITTKPIKLLIGNSGGGKTSSILKYIAHLESTVSKTEHKKIPSFYMASLDNQKIGVKEFLEKIKITMGLETSLFFKVQDLIECVQSKKDPHIFIIDTIGKNQKNTNMLLSIASNSYVRDRGETFLVIPANLSENDIMYILKEYKIFSCAGVIITKMDEAQYPARIIGICIEYMLPIAYLSYGPDISEFTGVTKELLLRYILGDTQGDK